MRHAEAERIAGKLARLREIAGREDLPDLVYLIAMAEAPARDIARREKAPPAG